MAEKGTAENAEEAARMIDEIVSREKTSRSAVFRRLGITGLAPAKIMSGESCTDMMLERVRTEHARVCSAAPSKAAKSGMLVAPREEPAPAAEEPEGDSEDDADGDAVEDDYYASDEDQDQDENEGDDRPRRVPARDLDEVPAPRRASRGVVESIVKTPARFGPTVPGKGAPMLAPERSELHRAADVIAALGGIDNAERVVDLVRALKGAA